MADMDIDIDLDMGLDEELGVTEMELSSTLQQTQPILSNPNDTSESNAADIVPEKVHLVGLDNLTTADLKAFSTAYLPAHNPIHVQWIDDTSANLIYETADIARDALLSFSAVEVLDITQLVPLQTIAAKSFPLHPDTNLQVRLAVVGDRKQAGARERSRFYLFNPELDPAENRRREGQRHRDTYRYRDREDGGYRSRRYDDREQQQREQDTEFDVNLYDDDADALATRRASRIEPRPTSSSSNDSRGRGDYRRLKFDGRGAGRELFPGRGGDGDGGRLRDRSASPLRDRKGDRNIDLFPASDRRGENVALEETRQKAQLIKARLREAKIKKELFPEKMNTGRLSAYDTADETADLFADKMVVPIADGGSDDFPRSQGGFSIRGAAKASFVSQPQSFSIKGAAGPRAKELFPMKFRDNAGKELFEGKGARRNEAEDLFSR